MDRPTDAGRADHAPRWRLFVDTGGTFTDCIAVDPHGAVHRTKVLSSAMLRGEIVERRGPRLFIVRLPDGVGPNAPRGMRFHLDGSALGTVVRYDARTRELEIAGADRNSTGQTAPRSFTLVHPAGEGEPAPILGARVITDTPVDAPLPPIDLRLATTRGTNALLERRGAPTALLITRGFADLLAIGDQRRPDLFARRIVKRRIPTAVVIEVDERLDARGELVEPLTDEEISRVVASIGRAKVKSTAISLLHSWTNPAHEERLASALRHAGVASVWHSSATPTLGYLARTTTTVVDAYLAPVLDEYCRAIESALAATALEAAGAAPSVAIMRSSGDIVPARRFRPSEGLLSGPAGGVRGAAAAAARSGVQRAIAFDMGGTSTDVARLGSDVPTRPVHRVGDVEIAAPALAIETVAAGGGSIIEFDGETLSVGPRSAGAEPGPACYGAGGPLTLTDATLLLGHLDPRHFEIPLDRTASEVAADLLLQCANARSPRFATRDALLTAAIEIADATTADAIAAVSVRQGIDPSNHALVAFGGAGGLHACDVAERLGMSRVLVPADAGVLSALGLAAARGERHALRVLLATLPEGMAIVADAVRDLCRSAAQALREDGAIGAVESRAWARARLLGQESSLDLSLDGIETGAQLIERFTAEYVAVYGHAPPSRPVEIESVRVIVCDSESSQTVVPAGAPPWPADVRAATLRGPRAISSRHCSAWIAEGWIGHIDHAGALVMERAREQRRPGVRTHSAAEPELAAARLSAIAGEMGDLLQRTAVSVNVKDRLDFSCGLLDERGRLVVNAPHVPVHLGALGLCVRAVVATFPLGPGDVAIVNHPAHGGSHLPDVTVITPIHERADGGALLGYAASRAHHAEIGGVRPGSMPPDAERLVDEAVVIPPMHLVRAGASRHEQVAALLSHGPHPTRALAENMSDIAAAQAANQHGAVQLRAMAAALGGVSVRSHMRALEARAARLARTALLELFGAASSDRLEAVERLDDGTPLAVAITIRRELSERALAPRAPVRIDFTGSGPVHRGVLNGTEAIVRSVVMYVLRLLVNEPIPLNEGLLSPVSIHVPTGILSPIFSSDPARCPAVGAGNTELSQRLVDCLIRAFGISAASQGTMNNLLFGLERAHGPWKPFGYYETIGGGAGASAEGPGADGVHTHMTNTRITDVELLERRYPVRVERFGLRADSGGRGLHDGGRGIERSLRFLAPLRVSLLSQRRASGPFGAAGGGDGASGIQRLTRADGTAIELPGIASFDADVGDLLTIETPGGGAWGACQWNFGPAVSE